MKHCIITLLFGFLLLPTMTKSQNNKELNSEQLVLRTDLFNFLKEEGFFPEIDTDGDIKFKSEGDIFYIGIEKSNTNPMYVVLYKLLKVSPEEYSEETIIMATKELNLYKAVKVTYFDGYVRIGAELFVINSEPVKYAFYQLMDIIDDVDSDFVGECDKVNPIPSTSSVGSISEIPFIITEIEVANVNKNSEIIQDYGSTIYDYKSEYLKPRITFRPIKTAGNYTVKVKLYKDDILQRNGSLSPEDCTFTDDVIINGNYNHTISLSGWGSDTAGTWKIGEYRYEVWYNDYCLGSKEFKII